MNRYSPPRSEVAEPVGLGLGRVAAYAVAVGSAVQLAWVLWYLREYAELVRVGAISMVVALLAFGSSLLLYTGAWLLVRGRGLSVLSFALAAVGLALGALAMGGVRWATSYPFLLGSGIALVGGVLAATLSLKRQRDG
jgi:hypothetical protein